jgi:AraC family transcriptional regulator
MEKSMLSQPAVHPFEIMKDEWLLSRQSIHSGGLIIEHHIEPPDELDSPPLTYHLLVLHLSNDAPRQVTRIDGREYDGPQRKGDFWLLPTGLPGFWYWESTDECLAFMISPAFLRQIAMETDCINPDKVELSTILFNNDPQLDSIALSFKNEMNQHGIGSRLYTESLTNILGIHLLRNYCILKPTVREYEGRLSKYTLKQLLDYINANLDQDIKLANLAQVVGMSQYYFCQLFKQSMGIAPYQYVIQQRVERAKQLLKNRDVAISEVALACGFANQSHFTKHFRKLTGITPKAYRER